MEAAVFGNVTADKTHPLADKTHPLADKTHPLADKTHPLDVICYPVDDEPAVRSEPRFAANRITCLDVVNHPRMENPAALWPCLPGLGYFLCNAVEASRLTGETDPVKAARGANTVIVKLGAQGCWIEHADWQARIPAPAAQLTPPGRAWSAALAPSKPGSSANSSPFSFVRAPSPCVMQFSSPAMIRPAIHRRTDMML